MLNSTNIKNAHGIDNFVTAFEKRLGRTPCEYIEEKIGTGSNINDIKYLFDIMAAQISNMNDCEFFDFDFFYKLED